MKRMVSFWLCFLLFSSLCGCIQKTGYMEYTGTYVKTSQGEHVLIYNADGKQVYFLLHSADGCRSMDQLKTGDKITIQVPCVPYEEAELSERTVYEWERKLFGHIEVTQITLDTIENLLQ